MEFCDGPGFPTIKRCHGFVEAIERYCAGLSEAAFMDNEMTQDAVIRNLEIIGEASHNIATHYPQFAANHPELPLAVAYQMRNAVAHGYFKVDLDIVWKTIHSDLPDLRRRVKAAADALSGEGA